MPCVSGHYGDLKTGHMVQTRLLIGQSKASNNNSLYSNYNDHDRLIGGIDKWKYAK